MLLFFGCRISRKSLSLLKDRFEFPAISLGAGGGGKRSFFFFNLFSLGYFWKVLVLQKINIYGARLHKG